MSDFNLIGGLDELISGKEKLLRDLNKHCIELQQELLDSREKYRQTEHELEQIRSAKNRMADGL